MRRSLPIALAVLLGGTVPVAQARWSRPFSIAAPLGSDLTPAQLGIAPAGGAAAVGYGATLAGNPSSATARVVLLSARGRPVARRAVAGADQVLAAAYPSPPARPLLLAGTAVAGFACCSAVEAVTMTPAGRVLRAPTIVSGLGGAVQARLVLLTRGVLAAVATADGVWVSAAPRGGVMPSARRLTGPSGAPPLLAATALPAGGSLVAWSSTVGGGRPPAAGEQIHVAGGTGGRAPRRSRVLVTVPPGASLDSLSVAPRGSGATVAWTESGYSASGARFSLVFTADLHGTAAAPAAVSSSAASAAAASLVADRRGDQLLAWQSCDDYGGCGTEVAQRAPGGAWGSVRTLGAGNPGQPPVAAASADGPAVVAWVSPGGRVAAAATEGASGAVGPVTAVGSAGPAADVTLAAGVRGDALAVWTQGAFEPALVAARFTP